MLYDYFIGHHEVSVKKCKKEVCTSQYVKVQEQFFNSCVQKRAMKHQNYPNMVFWTLRSYSRRNNDLVVLKWHKKGMCYMHSLYQENFSHTFNLM